MVYCVKGSRKVDEIEHYPFLTIKRLQDVVMDAETADTRSGMDQATYFHRCSNGGLWRYAFLATLTQSSDLKSADNSQARSNRHWLSLAQV